MEVLDWISGQRDQQSTPTNKSNHRQQGQSNLDVDSYQLELGPNNRRPGVNHTERGRSFPLFFFNIRS